MDPLLYQALARIIELEHIAIHGENVAVSTTDKTLIDALRTKQASLETPPSATTGITIDKIREMTLGELIKLVE